jgi:hypothetical protein
MSECLQDILISELPRIDEFSYDDLLVIDVKKQGLEAFETHAITWGHLTGVYPPGGGPGGGDGDQNIDNEIILNGIVKFIDGTELRPSITFIRDDNTGFYRPRDNTIGITTGGTRVAVFSNQYFGVGTDFPEEMVHVNEGNVLIRLGGNENDLYLGSSTRTLGGDPSIQSVGTTPLTFHVNKNEWLRINQYGAWGLRWGVLIDFGKAEMVLTSNGPEETVQWRKAEEIINLNQILEDIDNNMIGKGDLDVMSDGQTDVGGTLMPSGINVETILGGVDTTDVDPDTGLPNPHPCIERPNANAFEDTGWYIEVDDTVVRTDGKQIISGDKTLDGVYRLSNLGNFITYANGNFDFHRIKWLPRR